MQQNDLTALLTKLMGSLEDTSITGESILQGLRADIAPLASGTTANVVTPLPISVPITPAALASIKGAGGNIIKNVADVPAAGKLLQQIPSVLSAIGAQAAADTTPAQPVSKPAKGVSILQSINIQNIDKLLNKWYLPFVTNEVISVYLSTDTVNPVLLLPVQVSLLHLKGQPTSLPITQGSVWILSQLLNASAPAVNYTGLTISGGTLSFNADVPINNKAIIMPAGVVCTVQLNLAQPVANGLAPDNVGIDAKNAQLQLPTQFSFTFSTPAATITNVAPASWTLYGCANTFQYDPTQTSVYNAGLNSILIPCKVTGSPFTVSNCGSPFFTIQGSATILDGYWELPVAAITITAPPAAATGAGALAILCWTGLQVKWNGLNGGWINLGVPFISAAPGLAGIVDFYAGNLYAGQNYNLWNNAKTGSPSILNIMYSALFPLYYLSNQDGEEFLSASVSFIANIDRPVKVDGSPVEVKGTEGLFYQQYSSKANYVMLYDANLINENYGVLNGPPVTAVPPETMALTNGLLTATPATGVLLFGSLETVSTFKYCDLLLSFGLFYLIPALPDPYASTFSAIMQRRNSDRGNVDSNLAGRTFLLSSVTDILLGLIRFVNSAAQPPVQTVEAAFAIVPIANPQGGVLPAKVITTDDAAMPTPAAAAAPTATPVIVVAPGSETNWNGINRFSGYDFAMLDVSTNADLMGVSFSTMNIEARSGDYEYVVGPVDNSADTEILGILGLDLVTPGKFIRAFTVPEITWEPTINVTPPVVNQLGPEPPLGWLLFGNDGGPTQIFNNSDIPVPIAPIDVSNFIVDSYKANAEFQLPLVTASVFTLPFGMRAFALFNNKGPFPNGYIPSQLDIAPQDFDITPSLPANQPKKIVTGGLQIIATAKTDPSVKSSPAFDGFTLQLRNLLGEDGNAVNSSILGPTVDTIFNDQFQPGPGPKLSVHSRGVPLTRIDFSGYGASTFSNWIDPTATIAATSQAKFDIFVGRTSLEIIQVKSLIYPWGIQVVRTITMYRAGSALIYRMDSGWRAETNGVYDFSYKDSAGTTIASPYTFHPGVVKGVFNVTNIIENDLAIFNVSWFRKPGETYIDPEKQIKSTVPAPGVTETVTMQPVYFDADVQIDNVIQGAATQGIAKGMVPSKKMLGYVQLSPRGEPISSELFIQLLNTQSGSLGGPVDCIVNIGGTGQKMRLTRVDVSSSIDPNTKNPVTKVVPNPVFAGTARGTVILPKNGSWSVVQHSHATDAVSSIDSNASVPLIRLGKLENGASNYPKNQLRLANPMDLIKAPDNATINYGLVQNTATQKVLYQLPAYVEGVKQLASKGNKFPLAKFADAYHLLNSTSIFPNPTDIPDMDMSKHLMGIVDEGYQLLDSVTQKLKMLSQPLPSPFYFVNTPDVKLYIVYDGTTPNLNYDLNSVAQSWMASAKNITLNVDLGPFKQLVYVTGNFDSENGSDTAFKLPVLQFGPDLKPIVDILEVLEDLTGGDYEAIVQKAISVAMGNSGDNFQYKFHADKEIPVVQFPPAEADGPTTPLRLKAGLKVGAYFNETLALTTDISSMVPSAGAYFEFDGSIEVMCVSVGVGTIYAIGQVTVKLSADVKSGPSLYMKFGFGAEIQVGLPVVGNASVTIMAGIEMTLSSTEIKITAFLSFKGNADLLGGLVNITIYIEASGTIDKTDAVGNTPAHTDMIAEVTFAIDISIFFIINIDFSKSWSATKQVA